MQTKHLVSIGLLCEQFQRPYFETLRALSQSGLKPEMTLNLVPYFDFDAAYLALDPKPPVVEADA